MFVADLSSQAQVRRLASEVLEGLSRIDVLINNVGGYWSTRHVTADGLERTFALNHLAPFLLTDLLLNRLERSAPARVVTVASNAHATGTHRLRRPPGRTVLFRRPGVQPIQTRERPVHLSAGRRLRGSAVTANALHPGFVRTSFGAEDPAAHPATPGPVSAAGHEVAGPGRRHVNPPGVGSRTRAGVGPLLRQPATHEILRSQLRPGGRGTALGGERGSGQTCRGAPCVRPQAIAR